MRDVIYAFLFAVTLVSLLSSQFADRLVGKPDRMDGECKAAN